jgi:FKBP-type peptidyl-prolyl cis-trans isomerase 2
MRRTLLLAAVLTLALAACGGDDDGAAPETTAPEGSSTSTPADPGRVAADGDTVVVHYRGTLDDGSEFDSSIGGDPLTFEVGGGRVIQGFDDAVRGMAVGETKTVRIEPADAYGEYDPERVVEIPLSDLPEGVAAGDQLMSDQGMVVTVEEVLDDTAVLDLNHSLAGEALTFEITLVSIGE